MALGCFIHLIVFHLIKHHVSNIKRYYRVYNRRHKRLFVASILVRIDWFQQRIECNKISNHSQIQHENGLAIALYRSLDHFPL